DKILGTVTVVDKKREVFLIGNVRVHLDEVQDLGSFIEFEAVYEERSIEDKEREVKKVSELMDAFKIKKKDLLGKSYIDYLLKTDKIFESLKLLYSFESDSLIISEFKRKDVKESRPPEERFFWLLFNKESKKLNRLDFVSMESEKSIEKRTFSEGNLAFTSSNGYFQDDSGEYKLYSQKVLGDDYKKMVLSYFKELSV
ncbi:MAG: hypothetical protein WD512_00825, partial [Candidatus Paceibacterota bacterium]